LESTRKNLRDGPREKGIALTDSPVERTPGMVLCNTYSCWLFRIYQSNGIAKKKFDEKRMIALYTLWVLYFTDLTGRQVRFVSLHNIWELVNRKKTTVYYFKRLIVVFRRSCQF